MSNHTIWLTAEEYMCLNTDVVVVDIITKVMSEETNRRCQKMQTSQNTVNAAERRWRWNRMTRAECIERLQNLYEDDSEAIDMAIEAMSAQKTGKWYEDEEYYGLCKFDQCYGLNWFHSPFCPICGSKMEGEE